MEGHPARITRRILPSQPNIGVFPLIRVIEFHADNVEISRMTTQVRFPDPGEHVVGLELALALLKSGIGKIWPRDRRDHMNNRIDVNDAGAAVDVPDRITAGNVGANELTFQLDAPPVSNGWNHPTSPAAQARKEISLIGV